MINSMTNEEYFEAIKNLKKMEYRVLFVRFEREAKTSFVNVLLDGTHLTWIQSCATTQREFEMDCDKYLASKKYKEDYDKFMKRGDSE